MYSHRDLLLNSILDILLQNSLLPFSKSVVSSVPTPSGALQNFWFLFPFGEYLGCNYFTGFRFRQCSNHARTCRTLHPSETVWKLKQDFPMQWPIVRKDQLDSHARFIDATLDRSCSLRSTFLDGRHTLHGTFSQWDLSTPQVSHTMSRMCARLRRL